MEKKIIKWIKEQVNKAHAKGVVIGLSGGIDSSCAAILCKKAFPNNIKGIIMPCSSNPSDLKHAKLIAEKFKIPHQIVKLEGIFKELCKETKIKNQAKRNMAVANLKPRLRMTILYYFANKLNYLVVGTDNKTELMIGYFTKYGDGGADILPLANIFKKDIKKLAKSLNIPKEIINRKPSAGLWKKQTDEKEIGISYNELDEILEKIDKNKSLATSNKKKVAKIKHMISSSEHKRKTPPILK